MGRALMLIDPQLDFIEGSLPVPGAQEAMQALSRYIAENRWDLALITLDWHPFDHSSFRENGGLWPRHCLAYTAGAAIPSFLLQNIYGAADHVNIFCKGANAINEEYSVFANPMAAGEISTLLNKYAIDKIDLCGLAGDICVLNTLKDAVSRFGPKMFNVLQDFSPSLDGGTQLGEYCMRELICIR